MLPKSQIHKLRRRARGVSGLGWRRPAQLAAVLATLPLLAGCPRLHMYDQPRYEPLEASTTFEDGGSARSLVAGTVPRGFLREDRHFYTGMEGDSAFSASFPFVVTREVLDRGRERFDIFCSVCHDRLGTGRGMVVRRGYKQPPSFHIDRLRQQPVGYFFDVITNGFATMPNYAVQIRPEDRWAIVAYVRALQLSQDAAVETLPAELRAEMEQALQKQQPTSEEHH